MDANLIETLTPREREILVLIAEGNSLIEIAQQLHRSLKTIESHRLALGRKLKVSNRVELAKIAIAQGLISVGQDADSAGDTTAKQELERLCKISDSVKHVTGMTYINELCAALNRVLGVRYAAVCMENPGEAIEDRLVVSYSEEGVKRDPYQYNSACRPVKKVIEQGACVIADGLQAAYPEDSVITECGLKSYIGIRLEANRSINTGVLAVAHDQPLQRADAIKRVLSFFAARTTAELELAQNSQRLKEPSQQPTESSIDSMGPAQDAATELDWLQEVNKAVQNSEGSDFLSRFCRTASQLPGIEIAAICTPDPHRPEGVDSNYRYVIAISERGKPNDPMRYHAVNTPCKTILDEGSCCFSEGITDAYPDDEWLRQLDAESYIGIRLLDKSGSQIGGVGLIGKTRLPNADALKRFLAFFAPHIAWALEVALEMDTLRSQLDQIQSEQSAAEPTPLAHATSEKSGASLTALATISRQLHPLAGAAFLRRTSEVICETFDLKYAGICALGSSRASKKLTSMALQIDGSQADAICYDPENTPCQVVLQEGLVCLPRGAAKAYPQDAFLIENGIESFVGVRLPTPSGEIIGVMWIVDPKPLKEPEAIEHVLRHFAPRIGAELANFIQYEALVQEREELEQALKDLKNSSTQIA